MLLISLFFIFNLNAKTVPVDQVDLNRYMGDWYEIVSLPQTFTEGCFCTRAQYSLNDNGTVKVLNTCHKGSIDGKLTKAKGRAKVVNAPANSKLKVSFFWPFYGDYWIVGLKEDYTVAVISNHDGSSFWVLSRKPTLPESDLTWALQIAQDQKIDLTNLKTTEQSGCTYP